MRKLALSLCFAFLFPILLAAGNNPADYPLRIQILHVHWLHYSNGVSNGGNDGDGLGNVTDGDSIRGFEFTYGSLEELRPTELNDRYLAKWRKEPLRLEMLVEEIGNPGKYHKFDLKTTVRDGVYVRLRDGITIMTQPQYAAYTAKLARNRRQ